MTVNKGDTMDISMIQLFVDDDNDDDDDDDTMYAVLYLQRIYPSLFENTTPLCTGSYRELIQLSLSLCKLESKD